MEDKGQIYSICREMEGGKPSHILSFLLVHINYTKRFHCGISIPQLSLAQNNHCAKVAYSDVIQGVHSI
jgi:hypothetical protein